VLNVMHLFGRRATHLAFVMVSEQDVVLGLLPLFAVVECFAEFSCHIYCNTKATVVITAASVSVKIKGVSSYEFLRSFRISLKHGMLSPDYPFYIFFDSS